MHKINNKHIILGICVQLLDDIHLEFLLTKLKGFLFRKIKISFILPWIEKVFIL